MPVIIDPWGGVRCGASARMALGVRLRIARQPERVVPRLSDALLSPLGLAWITGIAGVKTQGSASPLSQKHNGSFLRLSAATLELLSSSSRSHCFWHTARSLSV